MRRPGIIHPAACRCDRCRPSIGRCLPVSVWGLLGLAAGLASGAALLVHFGPLVAAAIAN